MCYLPKPQVYTSPVTQRRRACSAPRAKLLAFKHGDKE